MKKLFNVRRNVALFIAGILLQAAEPGSGANLPADWKHVQQFEASATGLIKLDLPVETLDAARPMLEDLRLYDDAGLETPYVLEWPALVPELVRAPKSFANTLQPRSTVITLETGLSQPLESVTLETPSPNFIKPVLVEGSQDGRAWQTLTNGQPIFRQFNGASQLQVSFNPGVWAWLRLTVDDQREGPVPFTTAKIHAACTASAPGDWMPVKITERHENPGETRLVLDLGAANLNLAAVQIDTAEPLFTRHVTFAIPQFSEESIHEQPIGQGVFYRVAVEGLPVSGNLTVPLETLVRSRELLMLIRNQDSPPLNISTVRVGRRPICLAFFARHAGTYHLLTGNRRCPAPHYDLSGISMNLKSVPVSSLTFSAMADNPAYHAPEVLAGVEDNGTMLDVSAWKFRESMKALHDGVQQVEADLAVLSRASPDFQDLRIIHDGHQVAYVLEHTSITRALKPVVIATNNSGERGMSQWSLQLPEANLPVTRIECDSTTALFEREMSLFEETTDERGTKFQNILGHASWVRKPAGTSQQLVIDLNSRPHGDKLFLQTRNGDNPPIKLENFRIFHGVTRLLFKAKSGDELFLYFGNPQGQAPHYDLSLMAGELLAAEKFPPETGAAEQLKKSSWTGAQTPGSGGILFWGILAVVVVVLLAVIGKLLPKPSP